MKYLATLIIWILSFQSCSQERSSTLTHKQGHQVLKASTWNWVSITDQEYNRVAAPIFKAPPISTPSAPKVTQRLQWWVDQLDQKIRSLNTFDLNHVPKPKVLLIDKSHVNAFVGSVPLCVDIKVNFERSQTIRTPGQDFSSVAFDLDRMAIIPFQNSCIPTSLEQLSQFIKDYNQHSTSCRLSIEHNTLNIGSSCDLDSKLQNFKSAQRISFFSVLNRIHIYKGLVTALDEKEFVTILFHELAHYYKAHDTAFKGEFGYFYNEPNYDHLNKPAPDPSLNPLYTKLMDASEAFHIRKNFIPRSEDFSINPILFYSLGSLGLKTCSWRHNSCVNSCQQFVDYMSGWDLYENLYSFPSSSDSHEVVSTINNLAQRCLEQTPLTPTNDSTYENTLKHKEFIDTLLNPYWTPNISSNELQSLSRFFQLSLDSSHLEQIISNKDNTWDALIHINEVLNNNIKKHQDLLLEPVKNHWGFYTTEQEADDLSLEYLSLVGISTQHGLRGYHKLNKISERQDWHHQNFPGIINMEVCDAMILASESPLTLTAFGDVNNTHHSPCYRYHNVMLEAQAHDYHTSSFNPSFELSWKDIQNRVL